MSRFWRIKYVQNFKECFIQVTIMEKNYCNFLIVRLWDWISQLKISLYMKYRQILVRQQLFYFHLEDVI